MSRVVVNITNNGITSTSPIPPILNNSNIIGQLTRYYLLGDQIKVIKDSNLQVRIYNEENNKEYYVPISDDFIKQVGDWGWTIICKLGTGSTHSAFLVYDGRDFKTMLILDSITKKDNNIDEIEDNIDDIIEIKGYDLYMNKVEHVFYTSVPYSDNEIYKILSPNNYINRPIYILEFMFYTISEFIILKRNIWNVNEKKIFISQFKMFYNKSMQFFKDNNINYSDIKLDNIMIGYYNGMSYLKFVDIHDVKIDKFIINTRDKLIELLDELNMLLEV
ncbi:Hypothetical protein ORPV_505 [Orpheovirus IHUMI-LCC2]|uniref:Protein kinase n=1 Tax=Orpheovirus IHUMI-LCC2 TaxID=2023057 RepID=A0A2I2L4L8_9VIRU|nr:Hypothetical protein ORPV_505 [Orpheovirus IHUMI-LCC2]SNW62409.1 Hypothetical protein ORPV_505 [Orpheovirus IHUMI-LCC2]